MKPVRFGSMDKELDHERSRLLEAGYDFLDTKSRAKGVLYNPEAEALR